MNFCVPQAYSECLLPEKKFIAQIRRMASGTSRGRIVRGIGDDCAVLRIPRGEELLVTTDLCIEDVHFRRAWHSAHSVGHRCLARGLSDIAAMGGTPLACFLSFAAPAELPQKWAAEFLRGLLGLAARFKVPLAGGDTSSGAKITADIVVLGSVPVGKAVLRSGAKPGDKIYVTGKLGGSAAIIQKLYRGEKVDASSPRNHFYPIPRLEIGTQLRKKHLATAMIDVSDGLSIDLAHLCRESSVSAVIEATAIPAAETATLDLALHGGDDYELLFTASPRTKVPSKIAGVAVTQIGVIQARSFSKVLIRDRRGRKRPLKPMGWQHFRKN
jgi:thiamine-monophosphate kinase